jgi:hypothetical protein
VRQWSESWSESPNDPKTAATAALSFRSADAVTRGAAFGYDAVSPGLAEDSRWLGSQSCAEDLFHSLICPCLSKYLEASLEN